MSNFIYKDGKLHAEGVPLQEIAKRYKTPCYVYSKKAIETKYLEFDSAFTSKNYFTQINFVSRILIAENVTH